MRAKVGLQFKELSLNFRMFIFCYLLHNQNAIMLHIEVVEVIYPGEEILIISFASEYLFISLGIRWSM